MSVGTDREREGMKEKSSNMLIDRWNECEGRQVTYIEG